MPTSHQCASCSSYTTNRKWCERCQAKPLLRRFGVVEWALVGVSLALILFIGWTVHRPATVTVLHGRPCPPGSHFAREDHIGENLGVNDQQRRDVCAVER